MGINLNVRNDYSYLFNSLSSSNNSSSNLFSSINFTDYASIKNGSYGKLLKAYYAESNESTSKTDTLSNITNPQYFYENKSTKAEEENRKQNLTDIEKTAKEVTSSAVALMERGGKSVFKNNNMEEVYSAVSEFTKDYNALMDKVEKSDSKEVKNAVGKLTDVLEGYESQLKDMGITIGKDNKLAVDKDTFLKADMEDVKELFNGQSSLSYLASTRATSLSNVAYNQSNTANLYTMKGIYAPQSTGSIINGYF